jgi:hypothetical protein
MSKTYKQFEKHIIGFSDIATLVMVGCRKGADDLICEPLHFGMDGTYHAYIVDNFDDDEEVQIGEHYTLKATFNSWLKIYDDENLTFTASGSEISIYRAGEMGCIIVVKK